MDNLVDSLGRSFERLLRWVYPGALFIVLLRLARPADFETLATIKLAGDESLWGLLVGGIVAGVIAYLLQGYVVNVVVSGVFIYLKWDVNVPFDRPQWVQRVLGWWGIRQVASEFAHLVDAMARNSRRRWESKLSNWLDYVWGVHHATAVTGWLTLFFYLLWNEPESRFDRAAAWEILAPSATLLLAALFLHAVLVRVKLPDSEELISSEPQHR